MKNKTQTARKSVLHFFPAKLKPVIAQTVVILEDGVRLHEVICTVIISQKRYILLKCVFVEEVFCSGTSRLCGSKSCMFWQVNEHETLPVTRIA